MSSEYIEGCIRTSL